MGLRPRPVRQRLKVHALYAGLTNGQYVDALSQNAGGALAQAERDALVNQFNGNFVEAEMVRAFIESIEYGGRFGQ